MQIINTKEDKKVEMPKIEEFENELEEKNNIELENNMAELPADNKSSVEESTGKEVQNEKDSDKKIENKVDEANVIDKIKNFLAKIALMQEEAKKDLSEKNSKQEKKSSKNEEDDDKVEELDVDTYNKPKYMLEYYDLPYRYNETVVKVLAQTPKKLFVYWDISDNDREKYTKAFGDDFFYKTYPVLLLYNEDKKYVREIVVNDFANSWYIDIEDSKTKYTIQLGRKFRNKPEIINFSEFKQNNIILQTDYLPFADSNKMEAPNDHVLFESLPRFFVFRNVKTNEEITKELRSFKDAFGNNYDIKEFYQDSYQDELSEGMFDMSNPSSGVNSSIFK